MNKTQCDLSAGVAKLDITALEQQLFYRVCQINSDILDITSEFRKQICYNYKDTTRTIFSFNCTMTEKLIQLSEQLAIATELLHTVQETKDRDIIPINLLKDKI